MKSTYRKYSAVRAHAGCTGAEMARRVLKENGIYEVNVVPIEGELADHYDPRSRVIRLSGNVYNGSSVAALGVACHEAGHAVQHAQAYVPLTARNAIAPVVNFCSGISWFVLILGIFMQYEFMINLGILLFASAAVFQLITLPVEFNASRQGDFGLKKKRPAERGRAWRNKEGSDGRRHDVRRGAGDLHRQSDPRDITDKKQQEGMTAYETSGLFEMGRVFYGNCNSFLQKEQGSQHRRRFLHRRKRPTPYFIARI